MIYLILNAKKEGKIIQLRNGHPTFLKGREEKEIKVCNLLDQLEIPYEQADHEAASTMEVCALVDEEILKDEFIGCHPCVNTSSLKLLTKDLTERFLPAVHHEMKIVHLPNPEE